MKDLLLTVSRLGTVVKKPDFRYLAKSQAIRLGKHKVGVAIEMRVNRRAAPGNTSNTGNVQYVGEC